MAFGRANRFPFVPAARRIGAEAGRHADANRRDLGSNQLERVKNRQTGVDHAAWRVDVDVDVLIGVFPIEIQQLGNDQVCNLVVDRRPQENDPLAEQKRVDVEGALDPAGAFDNHWNNGLWWQK